MSSSEQSDGADTAPFTPAIGPFKIDAAAISDVGNRRPQNEDRYFVGVLRQGLERAYTNLDHAESLLQIGRRSSWVLAVADGVAGSGAGGTAASVALEALIQRLAGSIGFPGKDADAEEELLERLERAVQSAHERVLARGGATTMTLVLLLWPRAYVLHVGDSRGYHLSNAGRLSQFTRDQTVGNVLVDEGLMEEDQVSSLVHARALVSTMGGQVSLSLGLIDLEPGDTMLLCTDGLTRHVSDAMIARILGEASNAAVACRALVDEALAAGGRDNITVVVARADIGRSAAPPASDPEATIT
ncbi:MAG TPA: protein phosphatase 2C domain-containing protein [Thermoanaerobaculia bacterium]|nr:protein phosphatase 2C domain-containing protein [Thermoanaerobaculia bacterium]